MAFEIIKKQKFFYELKPNTVSITKYNISFSQDLRETYFKGFLTLEIYLDKHSKKVGLRPSNNIITGFRLGKDGNIGIPRALEGRLSEGMWNPVWEDSMLVIYGIDII